MITTQREFLKAFRKAHKEHPRTWFLRRNRSIRSEIKEFSCCCPITFVGSPWQPTSAAYPYNYVYGKQAGLLSEKLADKIIDAADHKKTKHHNLRKQMLKIVGLV